MDIPIQSKSVKRTFVTLEYESKAFGILPQRCDPDENCLHNIGWGIKLDDPICLARRAACRNELVQCVLGALGTAGAGPVCIDCMVAVGWTGAGMLACAIPCGVTAAAVTQAIQHCS